MKYSKLKLIQKNWTNNIYTVEINNNIFYIKRYPIYKIKLIIIIHYGENYLF